MSATEFEPGSTVEQTLNHSIGVVQPRESWFPTSMLAECPEHIVVEYGDGARTLTHPKWFTLASGDAIPTTPSGDAVKDTAPAPSDGTPSLVRLDQDGAMARVLNAAMDWERSMSTPGTGADFLVAHHTLMDAVRDYRQAVTR